MVIITDSNQNHAKRVCNHFDIKKISEYHDLYLKSHTLLLADVFENFKRISLEMYQLEHFLSAPRLAWQATLKRTKVDLESSTDTDTLLMVENNIKRGICHSIRYPKVNNKYMKDYDKNTESRYLKYWNVNNLHGWAMSQKLSADNFEQFEDNPQFNEDFTKIHRNLNQALNHRLVLKKVHRIIKFNAKAWLKSCIDMNTDLRKTKQKTILKNSFLS